MFVVTLIIAFGINEGAILFFEPKPLELAGFLRTAVGALILSVMLPIVFIVKDLEQASIDKSKESGKNSLELTLELLEEENAYTRSKEQIIHVLIFTALYSGITVVLSSLGISTDIIRESLKEIVQSSGFAFVLYIMLMSYERN